jgi:hypothetical protein
MMCIAISMSHTLLALGGQDISVYEIKESILSFVKHMETMDLSQLAGIVKEEANAYRRN